MDKFNVENCPMESIMKNSYSPPKLAVYGKVEEITQITGDTTDTDFIIITGLPGGDISIPAGVGSRSFRT